MKTHGDFDPAALPVTLLPDPFLYIVSLVFSTIAWIPAITAIVLGKCDWELLGFGFGISFMLFLLIHSCRIVVGKDGVTYKRPCAPIPSSPISC
ncbi:MAG: hypothetical protein WBN75_01215 [Verrucomicrobiia bacterium]